MKTLICAALLWTLCAQTAFAAEPPTKPKEGFGVFLVVFRVSPGAAAREQGPLDVTRYGGVEHERRGDVLVVTLPLQAWAVVEAHPRVAYVQRVWMGEPLEKWSEGRRPARPLRAVAEADMSGDAAVAAASWDSDVYSYDGMGNITAIGSDQFSYDSAGRIIESSVDGLAEQYGYDSFGNLTSKTTGARPSPIPPVDSGSNRVIGYPYDVAGNITSLPGASGTWEYPSHYEYDAVGMPVVVQGHSVRDARRMIYTADDERIALTVAGESRIWIRGFDKKVLREFFGDFTTGWWAWSQDYVWAGGTLLAGERETSNGGRLAFHLDHLGSVRLITKEDKTQVSAHRYLPFGVERTDSTAELKNFDFGNSEERVTPFRIEPMKFTSHERDFNGVLNVDGTDYLDYMHARFYAPAFGRFLSVDPGRDWDPSQPQSWNSYAYVRNNPMNAVDPDGEATVIVGAGIGLLVGGGMELGKQLWKGESVNWTKVGASALNGAVVGGVATATLGASLIVEAGALGVATAAGGAVQRGLDGDETTVATNPTDVAIDLTTGVVAGGAANVAFSRTRTAVANSASQKIAARQADHAVRASRARSASRQTGPKANQARVRARPQEWAEKARTGGRTAGKVATTKAAEQVRDGEKTSQ